MSLWNDVRYGLRTLRRSPGFLVTAVLTLGLGIGATTAIFSVCDAMLWKPIPLPHMESLVMVLQRNPAEPTTPYEASWRDFIFAEVWTRPGLDPRSRFLISAARGHDDPAQPVCSGPAPRLTAKSVAPMR